MLRQNVWMAVPENEETLRESEVEELIAVHVPDTASARRGVNSRQGVCTAAGAAIVSTGVIIPCILR